MHGNQQRRLSDEVRTLRRKGGRWLKQLREQRGLSQSQLAAKLGSDHYSFISQLESGKGRVPPERYRDWSEALGLPPNDFARQMISYYEPVLHQLLFGETEDSPLSELRSGDERAPRSKGAGQAEASF